MLSFKKHTIFRWMQGALLCLLIGCDDPLSELPEEVRYLSFTPEVTQTRAAMVNAFPENGKFGVIGFLYVRNDKGETSSGESPWDTKKVLIKPEPDMYNMEVTYAHKTTSYDPPRAWSGNANDKYTFFAYYPFQNGANGNGISITDTKSLGSPVLTYLLPYKANELNDYSAVPDVMIASKYDHQKKHGTVRFNFNHVLSCVDFAVNNLNTSNKIRLTSLLLEGTINERTQVIMDGMTQTPDSMIKSKFQFVPTGSLDVESTLAHKAVSVGERNNNYLLLIPQEKPSDWKVTVKWDMLDKDGYELKDDQGNKRTGTYSQAIGKSLTFLAGKKHTFTLNFLGDVCTIIAQVGDWETPPGEDNNVEFE